LKRLHPQMLLSSTYRQSSIPRAKALKLDADSLLLWRFPPRRLDAEAIRDSILTVTGMLNRQMHGHGFYALQVIRENVHHYYAKEEFGPEDWRRMLYAVKIRQERDGIFGLFDCPDGGQSVPRRGLSTTPLQALNLLNSGFVMQQAGLLAERLQRETGTDRQRQVARAFELAFGRTPSLAESAESVAFVEAEGLTAMCRAFLNANEFLFLF